VRAILDFYLTQMKMAVLQQLQYRVANYFYMIGMIAEPVIYLVVWSTVAIAQGGSVAGYTPGEFAAYYIVWTLVRNMNIVLTPYAWENYIQRGELSMELLRPVHPLHAQMAYFAGWKFVVIVLWLPIAAILAMIFRPEIHTSPWAVAAFVIALWGGFFVRFMMLWLLGMITFWTTRVSAIFELYFTMELLFSGRLVPMALLPPWAQQLASYMPFQWAFGFPIELLLGKYTQAQALYGLAAQVFWIALGVILVQLFWRTALRRFSAVGG
jgi:ABC-2 type transport system permease protein